MKVRIATYMIIMKFYLQFLPIFIFDSRHEISLMSLFEQNSTLLWHMALLSFDFAHKHLILVNHLINLVLHGETISDDF